MKSNYEDYTVKFNPSDIPQLYADWGWLIDQKYLTEPFLMTTFGDLFFKGPDASIHFIDTIEGAISPFAENEESAREQLADPEIQKELLNSEVVDGLRKREILLKDDELYIYVPHPALAAKFDDDTIQVMSMKVVISLCGQFLGQTGVIPPKDSVEAPKIDDAMKAEALKKPNGNVYVIDPAYADDGVDGDIPPEGIIGAYPVDGNGEIIPEFIFNPRYVKGA